MPFFFLVRNKCKRQFMTDSRLEENSKRGLLQHGLILELILKSVNNFLKLSEWSVLDKHQNTMISG